jgi:hypothetical protein
MVPWRAELRDTVARAFFNPREFTSYRTESMGTPSPRATRTTRAPSSGWVAESSSSDSGGFYAGKGLDGAIRALARTDGTSLLVVGDGESRPTREALAARAGVGERIRFAGSQPRERTPPYLRSADALVFPTLLPEASGLSLLQAMACGIPVLPSRIGAVPELVTDPGTNASVSSSLRRTSIVRLPPRVRASRCSICLARRFSGLRPSGHRGVGGSEPTSPRSSGHARSRRASAAT